MSSGIFETNSVDKSTPPPPNTSRLQARPANMNLAHPPPERRIICPQNEITPGTALIIVC
jgi:hypothetical protein